MIDKRKLELFKELFIRSESILIICANDSIRDQLFAATSLYATLKVNTKKSVKLLCPVDFSKLEKDILYVSELQTEMGHEDLCISLDYQEESIDKVSYHINEETKKFYLTIKPNKGFQPLSSENVEFSYTGAHADMIILMGVDDLESLGKLYFGYENLFNSTALVSLNSYETDFGNLKYDILGTSCFSEFVAQILNDLEIPIDQDSATNLLKGIDEETNGFKSYTATADTFEVISKLMRAGARRIFKDDQEDNDQENNNRDNKGQENFQQFSELDKLKNQTERNEQKVFSKIENPRSNDQKAVHKQKKQKTKSYSAKRKNQLNRNNQATKPKVSKKVDKKLGSAKTKNIKPGDLKYNPSGFSPSGG
ncbi:MAG: hypothetical protein H6772_03610 [Pseudomonadales bacterium]|nr:hypothetical protein [Pseudomonadales bacterium]